MATIGKITLPLYTKYNGKEFEVGQVEVPLEVSVGGRHTTVKVTRGISKEDLEQHYGR